MPAVPSLPSMKLTSHGVFLGTPNGFSQNTSAIGTRHDYASTCSNPLCRVTFDVDGYIPPDALSPGRLGYTSNWVAVSARCSMFFACMWSMEDPL